VSTQHRIGSLAVKALKTLGLRVLRISFLAHAWKYTTGTRIREWIASHNRKVKSSGQGVRIISCLLPKQSPWLNPIEPKWVHSKRKVVESDGVLGAYELAERVCAAFGCPHYEHLSIPENAA
jgi:hypothetical protein